MKALKRRSTTVVLLLVMVASFAYIVTAGRQGGSTASSEALGNVGGAETSASPSEPSRKARGTIRIGWTAWTDAEVVTHLVERLLTDRYGLDVHLLMSDIGIQYQGVASGDLDAMLMAWLPVTHASYWKKVATRVVDLGPIYSHARLGWAVPAFVPKSKLGSILDLDKAAVRQRLDGHIYGIDPGSGLMQASERALNAYGLDSWSLVPSSGAGMTAALGRAIRRHEWIVVTAWSPHWMFARWDLRYLDDPKHVFGSEERVHAIVSRQFAETGDSDVLDFLTRLFIPEAQLEEALLDATDHGVPHAVDTYLANHRARVDYWVTGQMVDAPR